MQQYRNSISVMESETIQKNEASSKSHTIRKHFFSYFVIATFAIAAVLTSCGGSIGGSSYKIKMITEQDNFYLRLFGSGVATVDWGDGSEKVSLTIEYGVIFEHTYPNASIRTITIIGDYITGLECHNDVTSLDVSRCLELTNLEVGESYNGCKLTSLDVSKNVALTHLKCNHTYQLTSLDVSKNTALIELEVVAPYLTSLDVSNNPALIKLEIYSESQLTSLDVSKSPALTELKIRNSKLSNLDVSKNTALKELYVNSTQLTSLDVSKNTLLTSLLCEANQLTSLDVSRNIMLLELRVNGNLTSSALNALFETLHSNAGSKTIYISGRNPGVLDCDRSIVERKGWTFQFWM